MEEEEENCRSATLVLPLILRRGLGENAKEESRSHRLPLYRGRIRSGSSNFYRRELYVTVCLFVCWDDKKRKEKKKWECDLFYGSSPPLRSRRRRRVFVDDVYFLSGVHGLVNVLLLFL